LFYRFSGSCTTPSVQEATIYFGGVYASSFPNNQWGVAATRDFNLTFRNCPRVNIRYYVHGNGRWVNQARGIVGLSNSNPSANPRGFGIQLQHRSGQHQHTGNVYIHQHQGGNPPPSPSYTRTYPGAGAVNTGMGVTHTIPLRARIIRTSPSGPSIQPGPFTTTMMFVIQYP